MSYQTFSNILRHSEIVKVRRESTTSTDMPETGDNLHGYSEISIVTTDTKNLL
jgi:hypothetical protein